MFVTGMGNSLAFAGVLEGQLWYAVAQGQVDEVKRLLDQGANANITDPFRTNSALGIAAMNGHTEIAKLLIDKGADVNFQANNGNTALMLAAQAGHADIAKLLIEKGANVNAKTMWGQTALSLAQAYRHTDVAEMIDPRLGEQLKQQELNAKRIKEQQESTKNLWAAVKQGQIADVRRLLDQGASVNARGAGIHTGDVTVLMLASDEGYTEIVKLLIRGSWGSGMTIDLLWCKPCVKGGSVTATPLSPAHCLVHQVVPTSLFSKAAA